MKFMKKHKPTTFSDLVFADQDAAETLHEYAIGLRTRPLLLYGPTGCGKTSTGRLIMERRMPGFSQMRLQVHLDARLDNDREDWFNICEFLTRLPFDRGYLQIDDVEYYKLSLLNQLDAVLEKDTFGTLILTAESVADIPKWALSRCEVVQLFLPFAEQYQKRALAILQSEGLDDTAEDVARLLYGFTGNWYELLRLLENHVIKKRHK